MNELIKELKENEQDFEWYSSTNNILIQIKNCVIIILNY